jgi:hypothetical protein
VHFFGETHFFSFFLKTLSHHWRMNSPGTEDDGDGIGGFKDAVL